MNELEAIDILKMEIAKLKTDFYPDRRRAFDKAIEALYFSYEENLLNKEKRDV